MSDITKCFGDRVRQIRKSFGWTQEELGEKSGLDHKYLGAVERGERNLSLDNIEKIAKGLSVEPYQLFLFSLDSGKLQDTSITSEVKIKDILDKADPRAKELILKISQNIAGWDNA